MTDSLSGRTDAGRPECQLGYPLTQLKRALSDGDYQRLMQWLVGQTVGVCDGRRWNPDTETYEPTGCGPHGAVVYAHDLERWANNWAVMD